MVPEEFEIYLEQDEPSEAATAKLLSVLGSKPKDRILFLQELLDRKPSALLIIDPLELLFRMNTGRKEQVIANSASTPPQGMRYFWSQEGLLQTSTVGSFSKTERAENT